MSAATSIQNATLANSTTSENVPRSGTMTVPNDVDVPREVDVTESGAASPVEPSTGQPLPTPVNYGPVSYTIHIVRSPNDANNTVYNVDFTLRNNGDSGIFSQQDVPKESTIADPSPLQKHLNKYQAVMVGNGIDGAYVFHTSKMPKDQ